MNPGTSTQSTEDPDANNRLRFSLNRDCLAKIFQYLDTNDLWTLGGMNEHFEEIINDLVLFEYKIKVIESESPMVLTEFFERHGKNIKKFAFISHYAKIIDILQQINQRCAVNQFKHTEFEIRMEPTYNIVYNQLNQRINFPIDHFREVETFWLKGSLPMLTRVSLPQFESLRILNLYQVELIEDFNWTALISVIELDLVQVAGINIDHFLQYIRQKPKLEKFVHMCTFSEFQRIAEEMAEHCQQIHSFSDFDSTSQAHMRWQGRDMFEYNYLSGFRNLQELSITSTRNCACDLTNVMAALAENNSLKKLSIIVSHVMGHQSERCSLSNQNNQIRMKTFTVLDSIYVHQVEQDDDDSNNFCQPMKLLINYSTQMLSNVETVTVSGSDRVAYNFEFIKLVPKLRKLNIRTLTKAIGAQETAEVLSIVLSTLARREETEQNPHFSNDSIELTVNEEQWNQFQKNSNVNKNIRFKIMKLDYSQLPMCDSMHEERLGMDKIKSPLQELYEKARKEYIEEQEEDDPFAVGYDYSSEELDAWWTEEELSDISE